MKFLIYLVILICNVESLLGQCGQTLFTQSYGHVNSLSPYDREVSCVYYIQPRNPQRYIKLQWSKFEIDGNMPDCQNDRVEVYAG